MSEHGGEFYVVLVVAIFLALIAFFSAGPSVNLYGEKRKYHPLLAAIGIFVITFLVWVLTVGVMEVTK
jgi:hypothetical protein